VNALTLQDAWLKRSFHGDYLTIRVFDIRELVGKLITKTGAAFYANSAAGSMFIGTRLCRWEVASPGRLRKGVNISGDLKNNSSNRSFYNSFKDSIITVITQAFFGGKASFWYINP
jgi:hypothetical protein